MITSFLVETPPKTASVDDAIRAMEFIQLDSIAVCGRIHDLILRNRVPDYQPDLLHRTLYSPAPTAFEYYFPNLCVLPLNDYPYFVHAMRRRADAVSGWGQLSPEEEPVARKLLARIDAEGPLRTRTAGAEDGHTVSGWGVRTTVAARVTEKLWLHGRLAIARRENFERWFDRTERVQPDAARWHAGDAPLPDPTQTQIHLTRKRLRSRRLFRLRPADRALLGASAFVRVELSDAPGKPWYALADDADALQAERPPSDTVRLLAPLDPVVYDRERTEALFGFPYRWEVYTPAAKRRWGYYVLPILRGDRLIGRVDPKLDRARGALHLHALTYEPGVDAAAEAPAVHDAIEEFARWLGASRIDYPTRRTP